MLVELLLEGVLRMLFEGLGSVLGAIPFRVWASMGLVALGIGAMNMAFAGTGSTRLVCFVLSGVCLVLSPVPLLLPRRVR